jgi:hypothetical protein
MKREKKNRKRPKNGEGGRRSEKRGRVMNGRQSEKEEKN